MATGSMYEQALVQEAYYNRGRYNHDFGKKRFVRAPFVLVKIQPTDDAAWEDYWMPAPWGCQPGSEYQMQDFLGDDNGDGECRHPFGYITRQDITMDESELGNWTPIGMKEPESDDNWKMFHRIGFI